MKLELTEQNTGEERATQRENSGVLQNSFEFSDEYWSVHAYEGTAWGQGKSHPKGLEKTVPGDHIGQGIDPIPTKPELKIL